MSRDASLTLPFGDGDYIFRLPWGQLSQLQEACDAGPWVVRSRLVAGTWLLADIRETIRLGLIGGGLDPQKALSLVKAYVEARPPLETLALAIGIIGVALQGAPDEPINLKVKDGERIDDLPDGKIRIGALYGVGAAIGFTPAQINEMSIWQFNAALDGVLKSRGDGKGLSEDEKVDLWTWLELEAATDAPAPTVVYKVMSGQAVAIPV